MEPTGGAIADGRVLELATLRRPVVTLARPVPEIILGHRPYSLGRRRGACGHRDAEDLAQDTFVRAFVHFERFDPERPVLPWLIAIARRLCLDLFRRRKVMARVETLPVTGPSAPGPEGEASRREQLSRLERALDDLDDGPRVAIVLFTSRRCRTGTSPRPSRYRWAR